MKAVIIYKNYINIRENEEKLSKLQEFLSIKNIEAVNELKITGQEANSYDHLNNFFNKIQEEEIKTIVVYDLTHLGKTTKELNKTLGLIKSRGFDILSVAESLDTSGPASEQVWQAINSILSFQNKAASASIKSGLENARFSGKRIGRPPISLNIYRQAQELRQQGMSYYRIGKKLNVDPSTIRRWLLKDESKQTK